MLLGFSINNFLILTFNSPDLLPLLGLVIIPIIVHLFNLRRIKKVRFSNTSLLKKVKEESSAKRKPKELIILLSRILAIACLVLSFAQPVISDNDEGESLGDAVMIYLDNSPSMSYSDGSESLFDFGSGSAQTIVNSYPEGTPFYFIENTYSNSVYTQFTNQSLSDYLTEIQIANVGRDLNEVANRVGANDFEGDVYLISDFSNQMLLDGLLNDSTNQYFLVPALSSGAANVYVDTVYLENTFLSGEFANSLKIELKRVNSGAEETNVKIYFDGQLAGTELVSFGDTGMGLGTYEIPRQQSGLERIEIELEDQGLTFDNNYFLSLNSLSATSVVEIYDQSSSNYVNSLFRENEFFQFERTSATALNNAMIEGADILVINGIGQFSNQLYNVVNEFVADGGTLLVIPTEDNSPSDFSPLGINVDVDTREKVVIQSPDLENPFFEGVFADGNSDVEMPEATTSFRLINDEYSLLSFRNGRPFLGKVVNEGNVFFFASPLAENATGFSNHALFVPVMYKLALGSKSSLATLYHFTDDELIEFPLPNDVSSGVFYLKNEQAEFTPDQRITKGQLVMEIPKDVVSAGTFGVYTEENYLGSISFNLPKSESQMDGEVMPRLTELAQAPHISIIEANTTSTFRSTMEARLIGFALWRWALALALLFLFVEIILIRYL